MSRWKKWVLVALVLEQGQLSLRVSDVRCEQSGTLKFSVHFGSMIQNEQKTDRKLKVPDLCYKTSICLNWIPSM